MHFLKVLLLDVHFNFNLFFRLPWKIILRELIFKTEIKTREKVKLCSRQYLRQWPPVFKTVTYLIHCLQLQKQKYGISVVDVLKIYQNEIHYTETSQLIWFANRLTGFYMVSLVLVCLLFTLNEARTTFSSLILRFYIFTLSKVRIPAEI